jgi:transcription elongation factor GreA
MNHEKEYLTKDKYEELKKELEYLRMVRRKEVAEDLEYAKQLGDLSENAEYHQAREEQAVLEDRIGKLDTLLKSATIVDRHTTDAVAIGSTVEIQKEGKKDTLKYTIVGSEEADMAKNKISAISPLGAAMMGKKKSELFSFKTPTGSASYKIISIA